jgi:2-dehydro-3-deoxygluconokinase
LTLDLSSVRRIACLGEVMIEMVEDGQDRPRLNVAGDTYNTAVYLKRLMKRDDVSVSYITALGSDRFSTKILTALEQHNIETAQIEIRPDHAPGLYMVNTAPDGERSFSYWRSESAARTLFQKPGKIGLDVLAGFDFVFLSGISLAVLRPDVRHELTDALALFRAKGGIVVYDSNHRPRLWEDSATARAANMAIWAQTDIALPSVDDEMALFDETDEHQVLSRLAGVNATFGALKRGPLGPKALGGADIDQPYTPVAKVIDTTAAGDSFNAGFLAGLIDGQPMGAALLQGHTLSSKVIQQQGAIIDLD